MLLLRTKPKGAIGPMEDFVRCLSPLTLVQGFDRGLENQVTWRPLAGPRLIWLSFSGHLVSNPRVFWRTPVLLRVASRRSAGCGVGTLVPAQTTVPFR